MGEKWGLRYFYIFQLTAHTNYPAKAGLELLILTLLLKSGVTGMCLHAQLTEGHFMEVFEAVRNCRPRHTHIRLVFGLPAAVGFLVVFQGSRVPGFGCICA